MRIIGGAFGGLRLATPSNGTRPTSDLVREALFSRLDSRIEFDGLRVLDLYAGSGALGLEAVSRGAESVVLVDSAPAAQRVLLNNVRAAQRASAAGAPQTGPTDGTADAPLAHTEAASWRASVERQKALSYVREAAESGRVFDLVFADPPYSVSNEDLDLVLTALEPALSPIAELAVERDRASRSPSWPAGVVAAGHKRYGSTVLWFAERAPSHSAADAQAKGADT